MEITNVLLMIIVLVAAAVLVIYFLNKRKTQVIDEDVKEIDDKTFTLEKMTEFVKKRLDEITKVNLYDIGLSEEELWHKMTQEAQLGFNRGKDFGEAGSGFFRINLACPRTTVEEAMRRLKAVFG